MKKVGVLLITLLIIGFYSCNPRCPEIEELKLNDKSLHEIHNLDLDNIKTDRVTVKNIKVKSLDNKYFFLIDSKVDSLISKGHLKTNFSIISNNFIASPEEINTFWWSGKYGCYNNVIKLEQDKNNCENNFVFAKLDRLAVHQGGSHSRTTIPHYLKLVNTTQLDSLNNVFANNINADLITNIRIDKTTPNNCNSNENFKYFNLNEIFIDTIPNHK